MSLADEIIELAAIWNVVARLAKPSALRSRVPVNEDVDNGLGRSAICVCVPVRYRCQAGMNVRGGEMCPFHG